MPSKTKAQRSFMGICCGARNKAKKKCPPKKVACEFAHADKGKTVRRMKRHMRY